MTPPCYSVCERPLCEKNSGTGVGRRPEGSTAEGASFGWIRRGAAGMWDLSSGGHASLCR